MKEHINDILVGGRPMSKLEQSYKEIEFLHSIIKKARAKLEVMFDNGDENTVLDDLLELDKILEINKED